MSRTQEVSVTLTVELYERLAAEARELGVALEWLVASIVVDTIEANRAVPALV